MNLELAHDRLVEVLELIDRWGDLYDRRWGNQAPYQENEGLASQVAGLIDQVRTRTWLAQEIVRAMDKSELADKVVEHEEGPYGGHPFTQARLAIVEAIAILTQREELAEVVGPVGPRLSASQLHPTVWGAAAALWDGGHHRAAVQTAATALEGLLQTIAGQAVSGENLAVLFSTGDPTTGSPRLRFRDVDPTAKTWRSAHEGSAALVRGAFMAVRNLVSHPGWPDPAPHEALEMLAVLSYVAHLVQKAQTVESP
ncbi:TIGR02391 family protein [Lentzea sp. NBC_00516]|uniref:TIGR02391 family protein n=1 Tax=Lentzea sp. NBC_00516 TaxID=2903582 RepID=UPI002E8229AB|nr:TIGR02391 family protein [Lentzea sp. NBC_00516]WUD27178.1 TIGR02391 family protein [Lentzea sp. NBC_00516]